jgi:PAS domain S-box-containing protein
MNAILYFTQQRKQLLPGRIGTDLLTDSGGHVEKVADNGIVGLLEAELDARINILNQTSMVTITDLRGTIIYVNDLFCQVSGYARHEVIGRTHEIIRHPELTDESIAAMWKLIGNGQTWQSIVKSQRKDRKLFWTRTTIAPVLDEKGVATKCIWVRNDISDLKQTEHELYTAKQRADQQLLDNVKNARRIQDAMLPGERDLREGLNKAFLIFSPQQNVSGDFYWFLHDTNESLLVLGDGSGHGVSASFVSLITLTGVKYVAEGMDVRDPGAVLTLLNGFLYRSLNKHKGSGLTETVDMSFCRFNHVTRELTYASARSIIWLLRDGTVTRLERDDVSIGTFPKGECTITSHKLQLQAGDRIFMMSDGIADQFGGERNKRFGSRHVKELISLTGNLPIQEQKEAIRKNFLLWKGTNEQTDDLSLLAFQVE